jgi:hypothetical protein
LVFKYSLSTPFLKKALANMLGTFKSFFYLSDFAIIAGFILFYACITVLIYWTCCISSLKDRLRPIHGVVAPFIVIPTSIFALSSALLGVSVWDHFQSNAKSISVEAQAIQAYITLVKSAPLENRVILVDEARKYARAALDEEWGVIATQHRPDSDTSALLQKLISHTVQIAIDNKLPPFLQSSLLQSVQNINNARNARLSIINDEPDAIRWLCIILLGVMLLMSVALVHLDKPKQMLAALTFAATSICIVVSLVGLAVNPFAGILMISKTPLEQISQME